MKKIFLKCVASVCSLAIFAQFGCFAKENIKENTGKYIMNSTMIIGSASAVMLGVGGLTYALLGGNVGKLVRPDHIAEDLDINEKNMNSHPENYFRKEEDGSCSVRDESGVWHSAGEFSVQSLKEVCERAANVPAKSDGGIFVVYDSKMSSPGDSILNVEKAVADGHFDLINPASNHNAIETTGLLDNESRKMLGQYYGDKTAGPALMLTCPWTSLCLLHAQKHLGLSGNGNFVNLLGGYGLQLQNGYVIENAAEIERKLGRDCEEDNNKFEFLAVKNASVYLQGGTIGTSIKPHKICGNKRQCTLFIDAAIPEEHSGYRGSTEAACKLHLKRHYLAMANYCRANGIKRAFVSLTGAGVFKNSRDWHVEVLNDGDVQQAIKDSGTDFVINAWNEALNGIANSASIDLDGGSLTWDNFLR